VKRPDLVRGLVLARPAWVIAANPANNAANAFVGQLLQDHAPSKAREIFEASAMAKELSVAAPDNLASLRSFFSREPTDITAQLLSRIAADGPGESEAEVMAIQKPTLVIGHGRDVVHPLAHARELAALIPTAKLVEITAKADNLDAYVKDFRTSLATFLKGL
jgi:pimeloyl-ACP methyl ester carboxylesterase